MADHLRESHEVPVIGDYQLVVAGGGVAGVGAALAARRAGLSVLLLEKSVILGGLSTLGFIAYWEPLDDGRGRRILGGLAEELLHLAIRYGYDTLPPVWRNGADRSETSERYHSRFNPHSFVLALDEIMAAEGVDVRYDSVVCSPVVQDGRCAAVVVEEKAGRVAYRCGFVIDATGDADLLARAGVPCRTGENWLTYCACQSSLGDMSKAVASADIRQGARFRTWGANFWGKGAPPGSRRYVGVDAADVSEFVVAGRRLALEALRADPGLSLIGLPAMAQLRTVRTVEAPYMLRDEDAGVHFDDSIGATSDFRKPGPVYEIPFRCLTAPGLENALAAGRCVGAVGGGWDVVRVIPPAVLTGQAAGTAAALALEKTCPAAAVPIASLQARLAAAGVMIHF